MKGSRLLKTAIVAGACGTAGAIAGIAGSSAAPSSPKSKPDGPRYGFVVQTAGPKPAPGGEMGFKMGVGGPPVHSTEIVPNKAGDGFDTVTHDSGTVKSVSGDQLTITEGTDKATYGTPTLTIPSDATIQRNFENAKLSDLQQGDHVDVSRRSGGDTVVFAVDPQHWPPKPPPLPSDAAKRKALRAVPTPLPSRAAKQEALRAVPPPPGAPFSTEP